MHTVLKENPAPVKARPFGKMYYPALDGMRGLAILLVMVYHNFSFIKFAHWGWSGVDLFFVLSGFLITEILIKTVDHHHYFKNFYAKRALRILPLYYLSLGLAIWILPGIVGRPDIFTYYKRNQLWLWLFLQNWLYIFKQPESHGFLGHLWSLAIEEQFYLIWPVVVVALRKPKYLLLFISCLILLTFGLRLYVWFHKTNSLSYYYFYSLSRYDAIWIGCSVALIQRIDSALLSRNVKWIVLTLVCLNLFFVFIKQYWGISLPFFALAGYLTLAILFGLLIQEGSHGNTVWIRKIFTNAGLLFLGRISFGLYVFHLPIYILLQPQTFKWWQANLFPYAEFMSSTLLTLLAISLSLGSYYLFERKFLKLKNKFVYQ